MIHPDKLNTGIILYKRAFLKRWESEKFKWEAVKHFQDNWNIDAINFGDMFMNATEQTSVLLTSNNNYPRGMIGDFAKADDTATRAMFINLFDETKELFERIEAFQLDAESLREKYGNVEWKQHYQSPSVISIYLWLRYPDKYYIYKYWEHHASATALGNDLIPKIGFPSVNLIEGFHYYDEICGQLQTDKTLRDLLQSIQTDTCYPDLALKTLTSDFCHYIRHDYPKEMEWFPAAYSPDISVKGWLELLNNKFVFTLGSLEIMKRMREYGGMATCTQLSVKYGETKNFYSSGSSSLAKRIAQKTGCPVFENETEETKWWPILYVGKNADKLTTGSFIWKLRDELNEALDLYDLSKVKLYAEESANFWWLNANPTMWRFDDAGIGETRSYTLYNDNGNKRHIFQNFLDAKAGDLIIGYEASPIKQVVAIAKITKAHDEKKLYFEKIESLANPIDYRTLKDCSELEKMGYFKNPQGSLFRLSKGEFDFIMDLVRETNPILSSPPSEPYSKEDFLEEVYLSDNQFDALTALLKNKQNLILQGAPGVGKTFAAKRLAYAMMGEKDDKRIEFIQFHQNYSYEDFIMGYRPQEEGFELQMGIFYRFCQKAASNPDNSHFFIIDEINRGNLSKIFGELLMLIEKNYRGTKMTLAYSGLPFSVPENIYIIGMMNTADRSLAMIDYALRRRFSFFEITPGFDSDGFKEYTNNFSDPILDKLIQQVQFLNETISVDQSLGKGFCIGHSYFCGQTKSTPEWLRAVVEYDILPMLSEYWFDDPAKLKFWEESLRGVFHA